MCRGVGPIKTPDGEPFADFVKSALVSELKIAGVYAPGAPAQITGRLNSIDFSSAWGNSTEAWQRIPDGSLADELFVLIERIYQCLEQGELLPRLRMAAPQPDVSRSHYHFSAA
jgi:hypothetical protein